MVGTIIKPEALTVKREQRGAWCREALRFCSRKTRLRSRRSRGGGRAGDSRACRACSESRTKDTSAAPMAAGSAGTLFLSSSPPKTQSHW